MNPNLLLRNIGSLVTNASDSPGALDVIEDAALAVREGEIVWSGPGDDVPVALLRSPELDVDGRAVIPGFVDSHTHLVFGGDRALEFASRLEGSSYDEALRTGGGIHATVAATRATSEEELLASASQRASRMLRSGTTTVEIKSGYGLTVEHELRSLRVAAGVAEETGIGVVPTYLAHVPDRGVEEPAYADFVVTEVLDAVAPYAEFCDVFVDRGAFSVASARRILTRAGELGLRARVHAEQLSHTGSALLASALAAASADHLDNATQDDAVALAAAGVATVLLPGVSLAMRTEQPPARALWDAGNIVALGTDCNPGTSYVESMQLVIALACLDVGLLPAEAVWAATRGSARSLGRDDLGIVRPGAAADLVVLDAPSHLHIPYRPGTNLVWKVIKGGRVVE